MKIRYSYVLHFDKVSLWFGKNCRFFNKSIFLVESALASFTVYENKNLGLQKRDELMKPKITLKNTLFCFGGRFFLKIWGPRESNVCFPFSGSRGSLDEFETIDHAHVWNWTSNNTSRTSIRGTNALDFSRKITNAVLFDLQIVCVV